MPLAWRFGGKGGINAEVEHTLLNPLNEPLRVAAFGPEHFYLHPYMHICMAVRLIIQKSKLSASPSEEREASFSRIAESCFSFAAHLPDCPY